MLSVLVGRQYKHLLFRRPCVVVRVRLESVRSVAEPAGSPVKVAPQAPHAQVAGECCGCLCADARWSCSEDTCTDALGAVLELAPEAGFFQVEAGFVDPNAKGRLFYAFQPADSAPAQKPLLVLFNGGPFTSMLPLWGGNTAPSTLDPAVTGGAEIATTPPRGPARQPALRRLPVRGLLVRGDGAAAPGIGEVDLIGEAAPSPAC